MDSPTSSPVKPWLLAYIAQGRANQQAFIAGLSDAERVAIGAPDAWVAKDHIAHNAAWNADAVRLIVAAVRGETPAPSQDDTDFNPRVFAEQQHRPWDAVLADAAQIDADLVAAIEACSEADLSDPARFPWRHGTPLWIVAHVCAYDHPAEHYGQYYLDSGDAARAAAVRQEAVETARRFIGGTAAHGYMLYNLGCFYAQIGRAGPALAAVGEALAIVPRLREWSAQDPDLATLHADPRFQTLVKAGTEGGASND